MQCSLLGTLFLLLPIFAPAQIRNTITLKPGRVIIADSLTILYGWNGEKSVNGPSGKAIFDLEKLIEDDNRILIQEDPAIIWSPTGQKCWIGGAFSIGNLEFSGFIELRGIVNMSISAPGPFSPRNTPTKMTVFIESLNFIKTLADTRLSYAPKPGTPIKSLKEAQEKLVKLGYNPGVPDGLMGKMTAAAIRAFQKDNHIPTTGKPDDKTLEALSKK